MDDGEEFQEFDENIEELVEVAVDEENLPVEEDDVMDEEEPESHIEEDHSIFTFSRHVDSVCCIAIHPFDHSIILSGGCDDQAYLWTWDRSWSVQLEGHEDTVTAVGFNFNGKLALTGSYDGKVRIWDVQKLPEVSLLQVFDGPEDVEWAVFHEKGNGLLAGSKDGTIWLWFVEPPKCVNVFAGHEGLVSCGRFVSDGKLIASGGEDGTVRVWNPKTGQCKSVLENSPSEEAMVTCLSSLGDFLGVGYSSGITKIYLISGPKLLFSLSEEEEQSESSNPSIETIAFHSTWKWVAAGGMTNKLTVWDLNSGTKRVQCDHPDGVVSAVWFPSQPFVTTASLDGKLRVWDGRNGSCLQTLSGHSLPILCLAMRALEDTQKVMLVTGSDDHSAKVFHFDLSEHML